MTVYSEKIAVLAGKEFDSGEEPFVLVELGAGPAGEASTSFESVAVLLEKASA